MWGIIIILIIVGVVSIAFVRRANTVSQNITSTILGEKLCDLFIEGHKSPQEIERIKNEFSISAKNTEVYLCLSSLYFLGFIRASKAESIVIPPEKIEKISHSLASFLVAKYITLYGDNEDVDELLQRQNKLTQQFIEVWEKNLNSKPSPHWYVGKEAEYFIKGKNSTSDLAFITFCAATFSNDTITIKNFLDEVQGKLSINE